MGMPASNCHSSSLEDVVIATGGPESSSLWAAMNRPISPYASPKAWPMAATSQGELVAVTPDLYYASGAIKEVKQRVKATLDRGHSATPSELRGALGISRKYLIPLLEYLDAEGFTRRSGEGRVLREEP